MEKAYRFDTDVQSEDLMFRSSGGEFIICGLFCNTISCDLSKVDIKLPIAIFQIFFYFLLSSE